MLFIVVATVVHCGFARCSSKMALELNNVVSEFNTLFECVVELHTFGARNRGR